MVRFEGACKRCGAALTLGDNDMGLFDVGIELREDGTQHVYTWIRHIGCPAGRDDLFSRIDQVHEASRETTEGGVQ